MVLYDHTVEDIICTAHYVPSAERGGVDEAVLTAEEVLAQLEDREMSELTSTGLMNTFIIAHCGFILC
jgi:hypothetical protein